MIQRRSWIMAGGLSLTPLSGWTQPTHKLRRIGMLGVGYNPDEMAGAQPMAAPIAALLAGLKALGYAYGEHFVTEPRSPVGQTERFPVLVAELIELRVDVIVAAGPALAAIKQATSTLPIVMAGAEDPVGLGVVKTLAHPGTNFTGLSNQAVEATVKKLELLKELVPGAAPVAVLWDPNARLSWQAVEALARLRGWKVRSFEVRDVAEIDAAIKAAIAARAGALLPAGGLAFRHARHISEVAAANRLPAAYTNPRQVGDAGLISYGADLDLIWRRAAVFVDKILRGAKPADLPVEQPTKFNLVINLKTAKALGLTVPQSLLLRADEVIQ
jgi:putative ABC transport system substrate-binding protein